MPEPATGSDVETQLAQIEAQPAEGQPGSEVEKQLAQIDGRQQQGGDSFTAFTQAAKQELDPQYQAFKAAVQSQVGQMAWSPVEFGKEAFIEARSGVKSIYEGLADTAGYLFSPESKFADRSVKELADGISATQARLDDINEQIKHPKEGASEYDIDPLLTQASQLRTDLDAQKAAMNKKVEPTSLAPPTWGEQIAQALHGSAAKMARLRAQERGEAPGPQVPGGFQPGTNILNAPLVVPPNPIYESTVPGQVAGVVGGALPYVLGSVAAAPGGPVGEFAVESALFGGGTAQSEIEQAREAGKSPFVQSQAAMWGLASGPVQAAAFRLLNMAPWLRGEGVKTVGEYVGNVAKQAALATVGGQAQKLYDNIVASATGIDPNRKMTDGLGEGLLTNAIGMAFVGAVTESPSLAMRWMGKARIDPYKPPRIEDGEDGGPGAQRLFEPGEPGGSGPVHVSEATQGAREAQLQELARGLGVEEPAQPVTRTTPLAEPLAEARAAVQAAQGTPEQVLAAQGTPEEALARQTAALKGQPPETAATTAEVAAVTPETLAAPPTTYEPPIPYQRFEPPPRPGPGPSPEELARWNTWNGMIATEQAALRGARIDSAQVAQFNAQAARLAELYGTRVPAAEAVPAAPAATMAPSDVRPTGLPPTDPSIMQRIWSAYQALSNERGRRSVSIRDVIDRAGVSLEEGRAAIAAHPGIQLDQGDWASATERERQGAVTTRGLERLYMAMDEPPEFQGEGLARRSLGSQAPRPSDPEAPLNSKQIRPTLNELRKDLGGRMNFLLADSRSLPVRYRRALAEAGLTPENFQAFYDKDLREWVVNPRNIRTLRQLNDAIIRNFVPNTFAGQIRIHALDSFTQASGNPAVARQRTRSARRSQCQCDL
jgi:hypothetical protein